MKMKLFICPGLSSPAAPKYRPGYEALMQEAERRGFAPELIYYPGQAKPDSQLDGVLSFKSSIAHVERIFRHCDAPYRLLGFSYGCFVAVTMAQNMDNLPRQVTLWGVLPYWKNWDNYCGPQTERHTGTGTNLLKPLKAFFDELPPIERFIGAVTVPMHVCLGAQDEYAAPAFLHYLENGCVSAADVPRRFTLVERCSHTLQPTNPDWNWHGCVDAIFADV